MSRLEQLAAGTRTVFVKINTALRPLGKLFDRVVPPYDQRIDLAAKLIGREEPVDSAVVRHFLEIQLLISLIAIPLGIILASVYNSGYMWVITIMGLYLFFTAYEMEEIIVSTYRIMVRRIGLLERILKIPSDEEHALEHVISISVGRAPVNLPLFIFSLPGFVVLFNEAIPDAPRLMVIISSTVLLIFALRINRRAVTLHLAGGLTIVMGVRKGVPKRIINAIQQSMYEKRPVVLDERVEIPEEVKKIVKETTGRDIDGDPDKPDKTDKSDKPADTEPSRSKKKSKKSKKAKKSKKSTKSDDSEDEEPAKELDE